MSSSIVLKALGVNTSPNALDLPNGSLSTASNVIIKRDNVLESRRGYKLYGTAFGTNSDVASQLFSYKNRILRQFATSLQFDTAVLNASGESIFSTFSGTYTQAQAGLRTKSIESNGNFYFTDKAGIKVISAASASDFTTSSGYILKAGIPKAIDFSLALIPPATNATGFLPQDSAVAYRTTWAIKDINNNLKIGSPSQPVAIYSPLLGLLIPNLLSTLYALNGVYLNPVSTAFFGNYGNYVNTFKISADATPTEVGVDLIALAAQIDNDIRYANDGATGSVPLDISNVVGSATNVVNIAFSTGDPTVYLTAGSKIYLTGFGTGSSTGTSINGLQTVVTSTATNITFNVTGVTTADTSFAFTAGTINSGTFRAITLPLTPDVPATAAQLASLQTYLNAIINALQNQLTVVISSGNQTTYITPLEITSSSNVKLTIQIPQDVTINTFLQIYRSAIVRASGTDVLNDLIPNGEETQLVYEAYPTAAELSAGVIVVDDITPDLLKGANLYTNKDSGEGILQANDIPPFALDINKFKNVIFYANTKTRHRIIPFSLIGVSNMITDIGNSITPTITIANTNGVSNTYTFVLGVAESSTIVSRADSAGDLAGKYFLLYSANNATAYYVWFKVSGTGTDPALAGKTGIQVNINTGATNTTVAAAVRDAIATQVSDFTTSVSTATITITNNAVGITTALSVGTSGFTSPTVVVTGAGESVANRQILLSQDVSVAVAIDETARSMVKVINGNSNETIYAYYISVLGQIPGKMVLESRILSDLPFYMIANDTNTGDSFFPSLDPVTVLSASAGRISIANPTVITSASHGLVNNDKIIITGSNSTPSINGIFTVTVTGASTFTIPVNVTGAGTKLSYSKLTAAEVSQNEVKPNRIYYSKVQQPEAVPIVNYMDVGAENKAILRIFPLRDSLFIFKQDGLFRISGETAPFYLSLFDSSCIVIAADSVSLSNNEIYAYTRQGISTIDEAGVSTKSRPIDTEILKVSSDDYTNFGTATWGVGYESDNSYTVFTVQKTDDTHATIGYRYSNLTNTWTTVDKDNVCGIVNSADDKLYLGAGDTNFIEQERKSFSRLDYADRQIASAIATSAYMGSQIQLSSVSNLAIGDVVVQDQLLTVYKYNALLQQMDNDPGIAAVNISAISGAALVLTITATAHNLITNDYVTINGNTSTPDINGTYKATRINANQFQITIASPLSTIVANGHARLSYYNTLKISAGANLRTALTNLTAKMDTDPGLVNTNYSSLIASYTKTIDQIAVGSPTHIRTTAAHNLLTGRYISISGSDSIPTINGSNTITLVDSTHFSIPVSVNTAGTTGSLTTDINSFQDLEGCFNIIVNNLNTDSGAVYSNYKLVSNTTSIESVITAIDKNSKKITIQNPIDFVVGPITIFKAITTTVVYSPNIMGDSLGLKHMREATLMVLNRAFTQIVVSFSSDLLPQFNPVTFTGDGNGIFGAGNFGKSFFGGASNSAPFRTLIPRDAQRCRYIVVKYEHSTAREAYSIYGISLTGEIGQSTRAYR